MENIAENPPHGTFKQVAATQAASTSISDHRADVGEEKDPEKPERDAITAKDDDENLTHKREIQVTESKSSNHLLAPNASCKHGSLRVPLRAIIPQAATKRQNATAGPPTIVHQTDLIHRYVEDPATATATKRPTFECKPCHRTYGRNSELFRHIRESHSKKVLVCPFPGCEKKTFTRKFTFERHTLKFHPA